jgi:aminoglycoside phosphotransferase (APT) family kinase protein
MNDSNATSPTPSTLSWAGSAFGRHSSVTAVRKLTGGISSAMHVLSLEDAHGRSHRAVLRQWIPNHEDRGPECVLREAHILEALKFAGIIAPHVIATDAEGSECGHPSLLMTFLNGHVELSPKDPDDWISQMAAMLVRIHGTNVKAPPAESWLNRNSLVVPEWTNDAGLWREALALFNSTPPPTEECFIHHDYQQFNLLWHRGVLRSVVDWVWASNGPPEIDVAHCRLNLSVLYSTEYAEQFLRKYVAASGRSISPWWDVAGLLLYLPGWDNFLQRQAGARKIVDFEGMHGRVEATLRATMSRA